MVDDFNYWEKLHLDQAAYNAEKERILACISAELEKKYPGFLAGIEVNDVVTPMTYVRYTGNYKGTYMTWIMTPELLKRFRVVKKTLPGLDNFLLSGMWLMPPGVVPSGVKCSRDVLQLICSKDRQKFRTTEF